MNDSILNTIRTSYGFSRTVTFLILIAFFTLIAERTIYYTLLEGGVIERKNEIKIINRIGPDKARILGLPKTDSLVQKNKQKNNDTKLSEAVVEIQDTLDVLAYELVNKGDYIKAQDKLTKLYIELQKYDQQALIDFSKTEEHIEKHKLSDVILQRHVDMVTHYRKEMDTLLTHLYTIQNLDDREDKVDAILATRKQLADKQLKRSQQPFDPNNLPFKSAQPDLNIKPKTSPEDFISAGLFNNPKPQYAGLGDFTYENLAGANNPEYLAETDEVVITDAIKAKAKELEYDPVKIYQWVLNNVEWLPTWGSMQDADVTLGSLKGNSFDISSLQIALLRASQIPARYVHGTIEVQEDKYRNWIGGFNSIEAASDFASSGGIPTTAILRGGKINTIRMEHIWVEAAIDNEPSRGAINLDADNWVQMDPSFKQYDHLEGLDLETVSGVSLDDALQSFLSSGTISTSDGQMNGFDPTILSSTSQQMQTNVSDYIQNNINDPKFFDVIGGRNNIIQNYPVLPSSLHNRIITVGTRYAEIPQNIQNRVQISFGTDILGQQINGEMFSWPEVNNHKVTVSYKPATEADEQVLRSLLPEGDVADANQLPNSISAYLINVIPELKIDGVTKISGSALRLGSELNLTYNLIRAGRSGSQYSSPVIAGSYVALTMIGGSISSNHLGRIESNLDEIETRLGSVDPVQLDTITREDTIGEMFYAGTLSYFSQSLVMNRVGELLDGTFSSLLPSLGTYGYVPEVNFFFGFPRSISTGGIEVDLDVISLAAANTDNDNEKKKNFLLISGILGSSFEHAGPEQMFTSTAEPADGVSAVKLLALANQSGQSVYHITQANQNTTLNNLHLDSTVMGEIRASLSAGKEVITHSDNLTVNGWTGVGYIIFDPQVGDGAYKISGGLNGGLLKTVADGLDKTIKWLSTIEKLFNKTGPASIIKKTISKIKRLVNNVKAVADIALACNPGFALLGIALYLLQAYISLKITLAIMAGVTFLSAACGPLAGVCAVTANVLFVWNAIDAISASLESTADYIVDGCSG